MSVIAAKFVAVFIACGSAAGPQAPEVMHRICVANVFPALTVGFDDCLQAIEAEAVAGELNLAKGGFSRTTHKSFCYKPGDPDYSDAVLNKHMVNEMGAGATKVVHYTFDGDNFHELPAKTFIPGNRF